VAGLGVLNDVTITQASAVWELADSGGSQKHLFAKAMRIGRDHIASTVYTIAFATAGASLSILLLIVVYDRPILSVLQTEQFSGEVLRTLVGSIGLVLAVPLTTAIGVAVVRASGRRGPTMLDKVRVSRTPVPAAAESPEQGEPVEETTPTDKSMTRRFRQRGADDDFGDFSHLRDPADTDPGGSGGATSRKGGPS
jgi:hypothetical protein